MRLESYRRSNPREWRAEEDMNCSRGADREGGLTSAANMTAGHMQ